MRIVLLLAAASSAFVAAAISAKWSIFDLDDPAIRHDADVYGWLSLMFVAISLVWNDLADIVRRYR